MSKLTSNRVDNHTKLFICETCVRDHRLAAGAQSLGRQLADRLELLLEGQSSLSIRVVACLRGCLNPANVSLRCAGKFTLRISRLTVADGEALVELVNQYQESADGLLAADLWPVSLPREQKLSAQIPPARSISLHR